MQNALALASVENALFTSCHETSAKRNGAMCQSRFVLLLDGPWRLQAGLVMTLCVNNPFSYDFDHFIQQKVRGKLLFGLI